MDEQRQDDQHEPIYNSSVPIQDIPRTTIYIYKRVFNPVNLELGTIPSRII